MMWQALFFFSSAVDKHFDQEARLAEVQRMLRESGLPAQQLKDVVAQLSAARADSSSSSSQQLATPPRGGIPGSALYTPSPVTAPVRALPQVKQEKIVSVQDRIVALEAELARLKVTRGRFVYFCLTCFMSASNHQYLQTFNH